MTRKKFTKNLVFSLVWALFLSLLITRWDTLKLVQWKDLGEAIKVSGIAGMFHRNGAYFLMFSLSLLFIALYVRHIRKKKFVSNHHDDEEEKRRRDRLHSPAYSSLGGNIHYGSDRYTTDKAFEEQ